jgi:drug/metabolite transporter (DMT)-like permease
MAASTLPLGLVFRLALAVILDTAVHIVWKLAVLQLPNPGSLFAALEAASHEPLFLLVAALFVWQLVNWLRVLEGCDLSYSQPITALSLILVLVLSALYLGESVDALKVLGIGFVFAGVWFISRTDHDSSASSATRQ